VGAPGARRNGAPATRQCPFSLVATVPHPAGQAARIPLGCLRAGGRSVVLPEALCVLTLTAQRCQKETEVTSAEQDPGHGHPMRSVTGKSGGMPTRTARCWQCSNWKPRSGRPHRTASRPGSPRYTAPWGVLSDAARDEADNAAQPYSLV
jgi:hypothetical protein